MYAPLHVPNEQNNPYADWRKASTELGKMKSWRGIELLRKKRASGKTAKSGLSNVLSSWNAELSLLPTRILQLLRQLAMCRCKPALHHLGMSHQIRLVVSVEKLQFQLKQVILGVK